MKRVIFTLELLFVILSFFIEEKSALLFGPVLVFLKMNLGQGLHLGTFMALAYPQVGFFGKLLLIVLYLQTPVYYVELQATAREVKGDDYFMTIYHKEKEQGLPMRVYNCKILENVLQNRKLRSNNLPQFFYLLAMNYMIHLPSKVVLSKNQKVLPERVVVVSHGLASTDKNMLAVVRDLIGLEGVVVCPYFQQKIYPVADIKAANPEKSDAELVTCYQQYRAEQLKKRVRTLTSCLESLKSKGVREFILVGHSFGCATSYQYVFEKKDPAIKKMILLDPWFFPVTPQYIGQRLPVQTLILNSQTFYAIENYSGLKKSNVAVRKGNQGGKFKMLMWRGTDHLFACDFSQCLGWLGKVGGVVQQDYKLDWVLGGNLPKDVVADQRQ